MTENMLINGASLWKLETGFSPVEREPVNPQNQNGGFIRLNWHFSPNPLIYRPYYNYNSIYISFILFLIFSISSLISLFSLSFSSTFVTEYMMVV